MKRPKINIWMAILLGISLPFLVLFAAWCFRDAFFPPPEFIEQHSDMLVRARMWNFNLLIMSAFSAVICMAVLPMIIMRKRSTWVWYLVMGYLVFGILVERNFSFFKFSSLDSSHSILVFQGKQALVQSNITNQLFVHRTAI